MDCWYCHGEGWILTCIDDMCQGAGECMHGDGEIVCPECGGSGDDDDYGEDYGDDYDYPEVD